MSISLIEALRSSITKIKKWGQERLPENDNISLNRIWVTTPNLFSPDGINYSTGMHLGDVYVLGENKDDEDILNGNVPFDCIQKGYQILDKVRSLKLMEDGKYANYIKTITLETTVTVTRVDNTKLTNQPGTIIKYYWTYPQYLKRCATENRVKDPDVANESGPRVGVVTYNSFFSKWRKGEINTRMPYSEKYYDTDVRENTTNYVAYQRYLVLRYRVALGRLDLEDNTSADVIKYNKYKEYFEDGIEDEEKQKFFFDISNVIDNEDVFGQSFVARTTTGQAVIEDGTEPFHVINKRQLDSTIEEKVSEEATSRKLTDAELSRQVSNATDRITSIEHKIITGPVQEGWNTIAQLNNIHSYVNNTFNILFSNSLEVSLTTISVAMLEYNAKTSSIAVINHEHRGPNHGVDNIRIVANKYGINKPELGALPIELQVWCPSGNLTVEIENYLINNNSFDLKIVSTQMADTQEVVCSHNLYSKPVLGSTAITITDVYNTFKNTLGNDFYATMSQSAITREFNEVRSEISTLEKKTIHIVEDSSSEILKAVPEKSLQYASITKLGGKGELYGTYLPNYNISSGYTLAGLTYTIDDMGGLTIAGEVEKYESFSLFGDVKLTKGETYYFCGLENMPRESYMKIYYDNGQYQTFQDCGEKYPFQALSDIISRIVFFSRNSGPYTIYPMITDADPVQYYRPGFIRISKILKIESLDLLDNVVDIFEVPDIIYSNEFYGIGHQDNEYNYFDFEKNVMVIKGKLENNIWVPVEEQEISINYEGEGFISVVNGGKLRITTTTIGNDGVDVPTNTSVPSTIAYLVKP